MTVLEHENGEMSLIRTGVSAHKLLHDAVMAVINANHAADLYAYPDVMEYFGSEVPADRDAFGPSTRDLFASKGG